MYCVCVRITYRESLSHLLGHGLLVTLENLNAVALNGGVSSNANGLCGSSLERLTSKEVLDVTLGEHQTAEPTI
jgi:hypothetical protein